MIYLNKGFFKPMMIIISIPIAPLALASWLMFFRSFEIEWISISLLISLFWVSIAYFLYKYSRSKKNYMSVEGCSLLIENLGECLEMQIADIVQIEYYRITSARSWLLLLNSVAPQSVFITYIRDGREFCKQIGYPQGKEIYKLCRDFDIVLKIK